MADQKGERKHTDRHNQVDKNQHMDSHMGNRNRDKGSMDKPRMEMQLKPQNQTQGKS